jgi:chromosome segregation ATPase
MNGSKSNGHSNSEERIGKEYDSLLEKYKLEQNKRQEAETNFANAEKLNQELKLQMESLRAQLQQYEVRIILICIL